MLGTTGTVLPTNNHRSFIKSQTVSKNFTYRNLLNTCFTTLPVPIKLKPLKTWTFKTISHNLGDNDAPGLFAYHTPLHNSRQKVKMRTNMVPAPRTSLTLTQAAQQAKYRKLSLTKNPYLSTINALLMTLQNLSYTSHNSLKHLAIHGDTHSNVSSKIPTHKLKSSPVLPTKRKNVVKVVARNSRFRAKSIRYSGLYGARRAALYSMVFNIQPSPINLKVRAFNDANVFLNWGSNPIQYYQHVAHLNAHSPQTPISLISLKFTKSIKKYNNPTTVQLPNRSLSLVVYTNSVWELFRTQNFQSFQNELDHTKTPIVSSTTTCGTLMPEQVSELNSKPSSTNYELSSVNQWSLETRFVRLKSVVAQSAFFILAKAPSYRTDIASQLPISTSRHSGNFHSLHSVLHRSFWNPPVTSLLACSGTSLGAKSLNSASILLFLKPYHNKLRQSAFTFVSNKVRSNSFRNLHITYRDLLYVSPSLAYPLLPTLHTDTGKRAFSISQTINLINKPVRKQPIRRQTWRPSKSSRIKKQTPPPINLRRHPSFIEGVCLTTKTSKKLWVRALRAVYKKHTRFSKWKLRKPKTLFRKFRKLNKVRKSVLWSLTRPNHLYNKPSKYRSLFSWRTKILVQQYRGLVQKHAKGIWASQSNVGALYRLGANLTPSLLTHNQTLWLLLLTPLILKNSLVNLNSAKVHRVLTSLIKKNHSKHGSVFLTNLLPNSAFHKYFSRKVLNSVANRLFHEDIIPYYQNTLIRFIEYCTGRKAIFQFYPFVNQHIDKSFIVRYKKWIPRLSFYERRMGHRFFLEEALHIMHISFVLRDPKIIASWLKAIILRISFWKTRSIFRFLKYLFHHYFTYVFEDIRIQGLKIKLKGKISAGGNSRKRTILYRVGRTSHSEVDLRVLKNFSLINTFTGVMGFQVYLFY